MTTEQPTYYIFLDDIRVPEYISKVPDVPKNATWTVVRSFQEFVSVLETKGYLPDFISYDHDLCMDAVRECIRGENKKTFNYFRKPMMPTGLKCVKHILKMCEEKEIEHPKFFIHSSNKVGAENMKKLIDNHNENIRKKRLR